MPKTKKKTFECEIDHEYRIAVLQVFIMMLVEGQADIIGDTAILYNTEGEVTEESDIDLLELLEEVQAGFDEDGKRKV